MYSEPLNKNEYNSIQTVEDVLDNLHEDTKNELIKIYGKDFIKETFETIKDTEIFVVRLKRNNEPVGLFGLIPQTETSAGIYLLTTDKLHEGNIITFLKGAKKQIKQWSEQYSLIMDNCYKQNKTIIKWLKLLGFKQSKYEDENFQIYFIGDINEYN